MTTFWITFIVNEAIGIAVAYVGQANIPSGIKTALEAFIAAGQGLISAIQAGK